MANPIRCDYTECPNLGDVLVTYLESGDTLAWCGPHYMEAITAAVDAAAAAEADQADAAAIRALEGAQAPDDDEDDELDADALAARLGGPEVIEAGDDAIHDDAAVQAGQAQLEKTPATEPAHIVRRGQSARARRAQARAFTEQTNAIALANTPAADGAGEGDDGEDADEDDAPTP